MQHLEGSGTPFLYIGRTVLKVQDSLWIPAVLTMVFHGLSQSKQIAGPKLK